MSRILLASLSISFWAGAAALAAGCYKTPQPECAFACEFGGADTCPDGYTCRVDNLCKLEGIADGFACPDTVDAAAVDAPLSIDAPAIDAAEFDAPVIDAPMIDAPMIDAPAIDAPMIDAPDIDAPDIDAPSIDAAVDALVIDADETDAPADA